MKTFGRIVCTGGAVLLLAAVAAQAQQEIPLPQPTPQQMAPPPPPGEASFKVSGRFTAQRRPRVTVFDFEDTNTEAEKARYGSSVEAMLVTFLKRKSQFVVVERQKLDKIMKEKILIKNGMIEIAPGDTEAQQLLEKIDAYILGNVTVLNIETDQQQAPKADTAARTQTPGPGGTAAPRSRLETREAIRGPRIEVDAKLLSRFDGRIIAVAQRSGPVACLRSIVERLGIALEQDFLRPYYGRLNISLTSPENIRVFLTPILLDTALDEEKPPVERSSTVRIDSEFDSVEPWTTDPTTYTIENLLSGWYSMRLERPGYESMGTDNARWEARDAYGKVEVHHSLSGQPLHHTDPELQRFVVQVDPLKTNTIDGDHLGFVFREKGGSLMPRVRRQYLDTDFAHVPQRVILMGGSKLDINKNDRPAEYADDQRCDLFDELEPLPPSYGKTYIASGQPFDFEGFKGGELIIEDYKGEVVPVGIYEIALWEPHYQVQRSEVTVRDRDLKKSTSTSLIRETLPLILQATGERRANRVILEGQDTHYRIELPLDFREPREQPGLPVDVYTVSTNISGLDAWRHSIDLFPRNAPPPVYDTKSKPDEPKLITGSETPDTAIVPDALTVKTRLGLAGRLEVFSEVPDPLASDLFIDRGVLKILDLLLYGQEKRPEEEKKGFLQIVTARRPAGVHISDGGPIIPPPASPGVSVLIPPPTGLPAAPTGMPQPAENGASGAPPQEEKKAPPLPEVSRDPDELRKLLAQHLRLIDLLVLDPKDMAQIRKSPEVATIIERYVAAGGALFAFVAESGDYRRVVGAPLVIEKVSKPTDRFELAPGEVSGITLRADKKEADVKSKRALPELAKLSAGDPWKVIAFTQEGKAPRIIEHGNRQEGGYVALWLDDPRSYYGRLGGTVPKVEEARAEVEEHILQWARYLMYRRYDKAGDQRRRAEEELLR